MRGSGGSTAQCASVCEGTETVEVTITGEDARRAARHAGRRRRRDGLGGTGTGGTGSGTGSGGGGTDDTAFGALSARAAAQAAAPADASGPSRTRRSPSDPQSGAGKTIVQGVLLAGAGKTIDGRAVEGRAGGQPASRSRATAGVPADPSRVGLAIGLALAIMWLGALQERRRVRLRVA